MATDILIAWVEEAERARTSKYQVYGGSNSGTGQQRRRSSCLKSSMYLRRLSSESRVEIKYETLCEGNQYRSKDNDRYGKQADSFRQLLSIHKTLADTVVAVKGSRCRCKRTGRDTDGSKCYFLKKQKKHLTDTDQGDR